VAGRADTPGAASAGFRPRFFVAVAAPGVVAASHDRKAGSFEVALTPEDSYHASRVLRLRPGDRCEIVFESSREAFQAELTEVGSETRVRLIARLEGGGAGPVYRRSVNLVQALARPAAVDFLIEKGTEVGVSHFVLVVAAGSPRQAPAAVDGRLERWRRIAREAAKQSKQLAVPGITWIASAEHAVRERRTAAAQALVLQAASPMTLQEAAMRTANSIDIWVGPEGGWSPKELALFAEAGFELASLGGSVLRTETAGPVAVALARAVLGDW
jgi:16S rRNA (uracil1498-N3)-methyltransferase